MDKGWGQRIREAKRKAREASSARRLQEQERRNAEKAAPLPQEPQARKTPAPSSWRADIERWKSTGKADESA